VITKRISLLLACLLAVAPVMGQQPMVEKPHLTIATASLSLTYLPLVLANRLGYFRDEGLTVEIVAFAGGSKALESLLGGSTDIVSGAYSNTLTMAARGQRMVDFVAQIDCPGWVLGVSKAKAVTFKSLADLKGMKIGVSAPGSSTHMAVNYILTKAGVPTDAVSIIGVGTSAAAVAAVKAGQLDALINSDPVATILLQEGDIVTVAEMRNRKDSAAVFGGPYPEASLYTTEAFVKANPGTIQAATNAIVRTLHWMQKATPDQLADAVPPEYLLGNRKLYLDGLQETRGCYSLSGLTTREGAAKVFDVLSAFDPHVRSAKINIEDTYTNRFVEQAEKKYPR
jgi:NitT/TauT family transport system substrate-binding protein